MLSRRRIVAILIATFGLGTLVGGVAGVLIFIQVAGGSGEPSAPISAPTLSLDSLQAAVTPGDTFAPVATQIAYIAAQVDALSTGDANRDLETQVAGINTRLESLTTAQAQGAPSIGQTVTPIPTGTPPPTATPISTNPPSATPPPKQVLFRIVPEESEARYIVDELEPLVNGLVGRTNQVAGDIIVDFDQPANSRVGTIRINLRTLRTDNSRRDSAVRAEVLLSAQPEYEFSDFVPTAVSGLPDTIPVGEPVQFALTGDLPLRGITNSVTFEVTVTAVSEAELRGLARTTIQRADYDLLQAFLADRGVSEEVILELEFVARAVEG